MTNMTSDQMGDTDGTMATARDEAASVAKDAKAAGGRVTDSAKEGASRVAEETKSQARKLASQATDEMRDQAAEQQRRVAAGLRSAGGELRTMAEAADGQSVASEVVHEAAVRATTVADWLDARDPGSLLQEVKRFARRRPGVFIAVAVGAGVVAGRLTRALAQSSETGTTDNKSGAAPSHRMPTPGSDEFVAGGATLGGEPSTMGLP